MKQINIKITTPERVVLEKEIDQATIPTEAGEITILANHMPVISALAPGVLEAKKDDELFSLAISGGFLEFHDNQVVILADTAEKADEIDLERAEKAAKKRAEELKERAASIADEREYSTMLYRVEKQLARVKLVERHKRRSKKRM